MKNGQLQLYGIGAVIVAIIFAFFVLPQLTQTVKDVSCVNEKKTIGDLTSQISACQTNLELEKLKSQLLQNELTKCQNNLSETKASLENCSKSYNNLEEEYKKKEQPITKYYLIQVYSTKIILFNWIILHNINLFGLFLSFGITINIKLFEIDIEIKFLNKKNQRKLINTIKEHLIRHPWTPVIIMLGVIAITNLFYYTFNQ